MKKNLSILSLFVTIFSVNAQSYIPIPTQGVNWYMHDEYIQPQNKIGSFCRNFDIQPTGDSIIQGLKYTVLSRTTAHYLAFGGLHGGCSNRFDSLTNDQYLLMRNDSLQQKVFAIGSNGIEYLAYDYTLQPGDTSTFTMWYRNNRYSGTYRVDSVKTQLLAGLNRKVMYLSYSHNGSQVYAGFIVEGIGGSGGILGPIFPISNAANIDFFHCFSQQGVGSYSPNGRPCQLITELEEEKKSESALAIYPNPTTGQLKIQANSKIVAVQVLNNLGQLVQSFQPTANNFNWQLPEKTGLYVVRVLDKDGNWEVRKIIKR